MQVKSFSRKLKLVRVGSPEVVGPMPSNRAIKITKITEAKVTPTALSTTVSGI